MSNTLKQRFPRCTYTNTDGTRCGRRVKPPDTVCHIHRNIQSTGFAGPLTEPADIDEMAILRKLARSSSEAIRLRAVDLLLSLREDQKPDDNNSIVKYASADQRKALLALIEQIAAIKRDVRIYIAAGGAPPVETTTGEKPPWYAECEDWERENRQCFGLPVDEQPTELRLPVPSDEEVIAAILRGDDVVTLDPNPEEDE